MAKKVALYLRSSKDRHDVSIESQQRELTDFVASMGGALVATFVDKVESAKTANRPGFQAMIGEVKSKTCRFTTICCYDTSRFSRRQYDAQLYKHLLKKNGVELLFLKLPKTDPLMDAVLESLMEIFDEFHSQKSKMDGLRGMRENIKKGWRAGGRALLGYKLEYKVVGTREGQPITKSSLVSDPVLFPKMQSYLRGRARGESRKDLMVSLGLNTPYTTLVYIEDSALTYAGHTVWNRHNEMLDGKYIAGRRFRERDEWVIHRDTHEAMITDEEAEAVLRQRTALRESGRRYRRNTYLLSGLLRCRCGANLDGDGGYYRCHVRCGNRSIKQETLEEAVTALLFAEFLTPDALKELMAEIDRELAAQGQSGNSYAEALRKELRDNERQITEIVGLLTQVKHQRPLLERLDGLEESRTRLTETLAETQGPIAEAPLQGLDEAGIGGFIECYRRNLDEGDPAQKKAALRSLLDRAVLDEDRVTVYPAYERLAGVKLASPRPGENYPVLRAVTTFQFGQTTKQGPGQ